MSDEKGNLEDFKYITTVNKDKEVHEELIKKFNNYKLELDDYLKKEIRLTEEEKKNINEKAEEIKTQLIEIFNSYYECKIHKAYLKMKCLIKKNYNLLSIYSLDNIYVKYPKNCLFRGRIGNFSKSFKRKDLFHIPFDEREKVATNRFSIPGQPCLYLGQTIFTIWQELDRPRLEELYISRFCADGKLKILDLAITYEDLFRNNLLTNKAIFKKYLITNIFRIASSIKVDEQIERSFKSNYILSQLLLQIILDLKIDGIRYISVFGDDKNAYININYAFPAKFDNKNDKEHSNFLQENFKLTEPVNLGLLKMNYNLSKKNRNNTDSDFLKIRVNSEFLTSYKDTEFYDLEEKIMHCPELQIKKMKTSLKSNNLLNILLEDIKEAGESVLSYTQGITFELFLENKMRIDAVIRNIEIIGEAVKQLPKNIIKEYPDIEWKKIAGLRDIVIHHSFGINEGIIWDVVKNKIPELIKVIKDILKNI